MRERKYIIGLDNHNRLIMKAGYVLWHRDLIDVTKSAFGFSESHDIRPIGGGFWKIEADEIYLYGESSDFGRPKRLEEALKVDGDHFRRQVTMAERRIQGDNSLDCREMPVVYVNEEYEKVYTDVGQENGPEDSAPEERLITETLATRLQAPQESPRGTNRITTQKKAIKAKKDKRKMTKKHYGKYK